MFSISENILFFIAGAGVVQGILMADLVYFHSKSDRSVSIFLAFYIICLSMILCVPFMLEIFTWRKSYFIEPFPMLLGPLLYFYARSFKESISWRKILPHLLFFVVYFIVGWWYYSFLLKKYPDLKAISDEMMKNVPGYAFSLLKIGWFVFYYFITRRTLHIYQRSIHHLYSETSLIDLNWAKWLNNGNILFIIFSITITGLAHLYPEHINLLLLVNVAVITPYLYIITYKGITQSTLWRQSGVSKGIIENEMKVCETAINHSTHNIFRQQRSGLSPNKITEITNLILNAIETDRLFQETEFTLQDLSDKIQIPAYQVSQAINDGMKKNFYDLINSYRVEEAKRLLLDPKSRNYTILSVGFEAGFNSKTTFNTVFKKFTGQTPTEFRDQQRASVYQEGFNS
jgi:AraC-like DNA-binding protein